MKGELKTPVIVVIVVVALALVGVVLVKAGGSGNLDQGQVSYTPGVPPWQEKNGAKAGPGGPPPSTAPAQATQPPVNQMGRPAAPPGMGAPSRG